MTPPALDGHGALELPVTGNWNQYIDTRQHAALRPRWTGCYLCCDFPKKAATGDVAMGFIRDLTWDGGDHPKGQRLFKIKDNKISICNRYESDKTDEDTGVCDAAR